MSGQIIETNANLVQREAWLRTNQRAVSRYLRQPLPCTVFTYSRTDPGDRASTRYGGLPYWPKSKPWPVCKPCSLKRPQVMQYIAQLDFRGNRSGVALPGDVLTLHFCLSCFPSASGGSSNAETEAFRTRHNLPLPELEPPFAYVPEGGWLTWHRVTPDIPLVEQTELPHVPDAAPVGPFYGTPQPAIDYPVPRQAFDGEIAGEDYTFLQFTLQGTKIGGYPPPIQPIEVPSDSRGKRMAFVGTLGSVTSRAVDGSKHPSARDGDWLWGDMGAFYLWISVSGDETAWFTECY